MDALVWNCREGFARNFELRRDQAVVATLTFDPPPTLAWQYTARHPASAKTSDGQWQLTVVRRGLLGMKADVRVDGTNAGVLEAGYLLRRGTLRAAGMPSLLWVGSIWNDGVDVFNDLQGFPVLRLDPGDYFDRVNARVSVLSATASAHDIALLASVGLYMRLLMNKAYR